LKEYPHLFDENADAVVKLENPSSEREFANSLFYLSILVIINWNANHLHQSLWLSKIKVSNSKQIHHSLKFSQNLALKILELLSI
jgi:hypothetical protein